MPISDHTTSQLAGYLTTH